MKNVKAIAMYFPQFHEISENNLWWGKGFTDWDNVKAGKPLFEGHRQPRVPLQENYYDLSNEDVIQWQAQLAKQYGIYGFSIYHYWFDGKLLLEKPKEIILNNPDIDIKYCLTWANETWARRWEGDDHKILQLQTHIPTKEKWKQHFDYLLPYFKDKRAIRIDDKIVFLIYRPHLVDNIGDMLEYWRELAKEKGIRDFYFIAVSSFKQHNRSLIDCFDGVLLFQPHMATNTTTVKGISVLIEDLLRRLPETWVERFRALHKKTLNKYVKHDYQTVCEVALKQKALYSPKDTYNMAFLEWDNTARYKDKSTLYNGCTPKIFEFEFQRLVHQAKMNEYDKRIVFINAWNEWAEGTYLEPDTNYEYSYLEIIENVVRNSY